MKKTRAIQLAGVVCVAIVVGVLMYWTSHRDRKSGPLIENRLPNEGECIEERGDFIPYYSVNDSDMVLFSLGNLQYQAGSGTWCNEVNVDGCVCDNNSYDPEGEWLRLFGWSGRNRTAPYGVSESERLADYRGEFVDWGRNRIDTIEGNEWRTLSIDEWDYLFCKRENADILWSKATLEGMAGLILLPDNYTDMAPIPWTGKAEDYGTYCFSMEQWAEMDIAGAVFLPASGRRVGKEVREEQERGYYWSSTAVEGDREKAYCVSFGERLETRDAVPRPTGLSVRLVRDL